MVNAFQKWGIKWISDNQMEGHKEYLLGGLNALFETRSEARQFIVKHYGYIKHRPDLQMEPYGWKMPQAVKVQVTIWER